MLPKNLTEIFLILAVSSNIVAYLIYFYSMWKGRIKPHAFTFLAWSLIGGLNFAIQIMSGVGEGALLLATNFIFCFGIFLYSSIKYRVKYDRTDWICLSLAILAIVLWLVTKTPLYSVVLSCVVDLFAFLPSFRKSFHKPNDDSALTFFVSGFEYLLSFPAYKTFSVVVLLYPAWVLTLDFAYAGMILVRRGMLKRAHLETL